MSGHIIGYKIDNKKEDNPELRLRFRIVATSSISNIEYNNQVQQQPHFKESVTAYLLKYSTTLLISKYKITGGRRYRSSTNYVIDIFDNNTKVLIRM